MIMLKSTHDAKVAAAIRTSSALAETRLQNNNGLRQLLNAANANCADFRVQIAAMESRVAKIQPAADKWNAAQHKRQAKRDAKNVTATGKIRKVVGAWT